jgi:putative hemolysin
VETIILTEEPPSQYLTSLMAFEPNWFYIFGFSGIILLLIVSAIISASEVSFFSLKSEHLEGCRNSDHASDKNVTELLKKPRLLLATILICHDFVNVGVVTISTFLMWEMTTPENLLRLLSGL